MMFMRAVLVAIVGLSIAVAADRLLLPSLASVPSSGSLTLSGSLGGENFPFGCPDPFGTAFPFVDKDKHGVIGDIGHKDKDKCPSPTPPPDDGTPPPDDGTPPPDDGTPPPDDGTPPPDDGTPPPDDGTPPPDDGTPPPTTGPTDAPTPPPSGAIVVTKYHDLDRDGVRDLGEPALSGWVFTIHTGGNAFVTSLTTNSSGLATATGLAPGTYVVTEIPQPGWTNTAPGGPTPARTVSVASGGTSVVDFGNAEIVVIPPTSAGMLVITKYNDLNANGVRDANEPALAGWTFTLRSSGGVTLTSAVTGSDGTATFPSVSFGTYTVVETTQQGWISSDPGGAAPTKIVTVDSATTSVSFGNYEAKLPDTSTAPRDGAPVALLGAILMAQALLVPLAVRRRWSRA